MKLSGLSLSLFQPLVVLHITNIAFSLLKQNCPSLVLSPSDRGYGDVNFCIIDLDKILSCPISPLMLAALLLRSPTLCDEVMYLCQLDMIQVVTGGIAVYFFMVWSLHFQLPYCGFSGSSMLDQDWTNLQMKLTRRVCQSYLECHCYQSVRNNKIFLLETSCLNYGNEIISLESSIQVIILVRYQ